MHASRSKPPRGAQGPVRGLGLTVATMAVAGTLLMPASVAAQAPLSVIPPGTPDGFVAQTADTQAGGHSDAVTSFTLTPQPFVNGGASPLKDTIVDLPPGLVGNPQAAAKCFQADLLPELDAQSTGSRCPAESQIGTVIIRFGLAPGVTVPLGTFPLYNMVPPPGSPADFAFLDPPTVLPIHITASVRGGDYGLRLTGKNALQFFAISSVTVNVWGVPADPSHDDLRKPCLTDQGTVTGNFCPTTAERKSFLSNPTVCDAPKLTSIQVNSWPAPNVFSDPVTAMAPTPTRCDRLQFAPEMSVAPDSSTPDAPTGLTAEVRMPVNDDPDGLAPAMLKDAVVMLPKGMAASPSAADGLQACTDDQMSVKTLAPPACPDASKIGSGELVTPLLPEPLGASIYLGTQRPEQLLRVFLVVESERYGIRVKIPGVVDQDKGDGQLTARFLSNPQLPFERLRLRFKSGPRAPLATPTTCGIKGVTSAMTAWSGQLVTSTDAFAITSPGGGVPCVEREEQLPFAPTLHGGTVIPSAGRASSLLVRIDRPDHQQFIDRLNLTMPIGIIAKVKGVPLCSSALASQGQCAAASRIGSAAVGVGPGSNPFFTKPEFGSVYLTEGYRGAPYGLVVVVRAVAGPFDLGTVIVRQAVDVDPTDAHLTVRSDQVPSILEGIPLRLRAINVNVDRAGFVMNPTSCTEKRIGATMTSTVGGAAASEARFQVGDCSKLPLSPKLALRLTGKDQTNVGGHPGVKAALTQPAGQTNLGRVGVSLPLSLALDPDNAASDSLCGFEASQGAEPNCPRSSTIGSARAVTRVLERPLRGPVYFVKNVRRDPKTGRLIRTLPTLLIALRGEVALNLRATTSVSRGRLVTTFADVPDAPISRFDLTLGGGKKGILVVTGRRSVCSGAQVAALDMRGQNGKRTSRDATIKTPCGR